MKERLPERVTGCLLKHAGGATPVPMEFSGEMFFPGDVSASFYCSFCTENQQWANVSGTRGYVHIADFVLPFFGSEVAFEVNSPTYHVQGCDFNMENHTRRIAVSEYSNGAANAQETHMIETFSRIVTTGRLEPRWGEQALSTQCVLDACLRSAKAGGQVISVS
jgi:predicted dehydrogenase